MADEVKVGDKLPSVALKEGQANYETPVDINLLDLIAGKKVAIFAVPGAFTPGMFCLGNAVFCLGNVTGIVDSQFFTKKIINNYKGCSKSHLPSFITAQEELKAKGVDMTICIATNDAYVMEVRENVHHVFTNIFFTCWASRSITYSLTFLICSLLREIQTYISFMLMFYVEPLSTGMGSYLWRCRSWNPLSLGCQCRIIEGSRFVHRRGGDGTN